MRFPADRIKKAILHSKIETRERATRYFASSYSDDPSIMMLVIDAVEKFGRHEAYRLIGPSRDLPQTEDSISWIIDELNDDDSDRHEKYTDNLSMVLATADPARLLPRESEALEARHFSDRLRLPVTERFQMLSWDETTCWQRLEAFCEQAKDKQWANEVDLDHAHRIVEALARHGEQCREKVHAVLSQKVDDYRHHPMNWLEPLVVRLAGEARLHSAVPLLIAKLLEDGGDILNSACAQALTRIGTSTVVKAVAEAYPSAPQHFRIYAIEPLEHIRSDLAVETCLRLLRHEEDRGIQIHLAYALLSQFSLEGIEAARQLLLDQDLDFESRGLRNHLLETCAIIGERFPEYEEWRTAAEAEAQEHWKRIKELEGDSAGLLRYALEKLTGKTGKQFPDHGSVPAAGPPRAARSKLEGRRKVGRNAPCPCGSGRKYKNCCLRGQT